MRPLPAIVVLFLAATASAGQLPPGPFDEAACRSCHAGATPAILAAWRAGPHGREGSAAGCSACHGERHDGAAARARKDETCIGCHGGAAGPLAASYASSKHGIIAALEAPRRDWTLPLAAANQRAPSCAYCHLHEGRHGATAAEAPRAACLDCHSPRFAETMAQAAERTLAVGRLKLREAEDAVAATPSVPAAGPILARMRGGLAALAAGAAHDSPDWQWWHGQAALDGELVRLKAILTRERRGQAVGARQ